MKSINNEHLRKNTLLNKIHSDLFHFFHLICEVSVHPVGIEELQGIILILGAFL